MEPISNKEIKDILLSGLAQADITVVGDGYQYQVTIICDSFDGNSTVQRHKQVYALLNDVIAEGRLHALSLKTLTPAEANQAGLRHTGD